MRHPFSVAVYFGFALMCARPSQAQEIFGVPGDGVTPSFAQLVSMHQLKVQEMTSPANSTPKGDATFSVPVPLPPAILAPAVSLDYSSAAAFNDESATGWSIAAPLEIQRTTERALGTDAFRVSGDGLSGVLLPDGVGVWRLHANAPMLAVAELDGADTWELRHNGMVWTLEATDEGAGTFGTSTWRATSKVDGYGNLIEYGYNPDGTLSWLSYGGTEGFGGKPHVAEVVFDYDSPAHEHHSVAGGAWETYDNLLTTITVRSADPATGLIASRYHYDLVYEDLTYVYLGTPVETEVLRAVERRSADGLLLETVAEMVYSTYDGSFDEVTFAGPAVGLGGSHTWTSSIGPTTTSETWSESALIDLNGDSFPDHVTSGLAGSSWSVVLGTAAGFDASSHPLVGGSPSHAVHESRTTKSAESTGENVTLSRLTDLDGDGYPDLVVSDDSAVWEVWYGTGTGFEADYTPEPAPFGTQSRRLVPDEDTPDNRDLLRDLMDIDGDRWLDIIEIDGLSDELCTHAGYRGGGWTCTGLSRPGGVTALEMVEQIYVGGRLESTHQVTGLHDLNADGFPDLVDARDWAATGQWDIYLGNGAGFEAVPVPWDAPVGELTASYDATPSTNLNLGLTTELTCNNYSLWGTMPGCVWTGIPDPSGETDPEGPCTCNSPSSDVSSIHHMIADVDLDGQPDLVIADLGPGTWYRNQGDGFDPAGTPLPVWWGNIFQGAMSTVSTNGPDSGSDTTNVVSMADLDGDGATDLLDDRGAAFARYSRSAKPFKLVEIRRPTGATTTLTYTPSNTQDPSLGTWAAHTAPTSKDVVATITDEDTVTGRSATRTFTYLDAVHADEVFQGFGVVEQTLAVDGALRYERTTVHELDPWREPLPVGEEVRTRDIDGDFTWRGRVDTVYGLHGTLKLAEDVVVWGSGEDAGEPPVRTEITFGWDDNGNLLSYVHDGGGVTQDALDMAFDYASDSGGELWRMVRRTTHGYDPVEAVYRDVAVTDYFYDEQSGDPLAQTLLVGALTHERQHAGWYGGGEVGVGLLDDTLTLEWAYGRGSRGELETVTDVTRGVMTLYSYGFGGAVRTTEENPLLQTTTWELDALGRQETRVDPNGLRTTTRFDAFGRPVEDAITRVGDVEHTLRTYTHDVSDAPAYVRTVQHVIAGPEVTSYQVSDGYGHPIQSWHQDHLGEWVVENQEPDLLGNVLSTWHPTPPGVGFSRGNAIAQWDGRVDPLRVATYDAFGNDRDVIEDATAGIGMSHPARVYLSRPWERVEVDEDRYGKRLRYDAHGRLVEVAEVFDPEAYDEPAWVVTAQYAYDAAHQLVQFVDGAGNTWQYSQDGAGRLREVRRGPSPAATSWWYRYDYDGLHKIEQIDSAGQTASWTHDALGRPLTLNVSDPVEASGSATYTWSYDGDWIGAVDSTTDPAGGEVYTYDAQGLPELATRAYTNHADVELGWQHDIQGRVVRRDYPSGYAVHTDRAYGWMTRSRAPGAAAGAQLTVDYDYDLWGTVSAWTSNTGVVGTRTRTTPLWPDEVSLTTGVQTRGREFEWSDGGLLQVRRAPGKFEETYLYHPERRQLASVVDSFPGGPSIAYTYDTAGNVVTSAPMGGPPIQYGGGGGGMGELGEVPDRLMPSGLVETFDYDDAGRMEQIVSGVNVTSYAYDGLGRLRQVTENGVVVRVLDRNADGLVVRRTDLDGATATDVWDFQDWTEDEASGVAQERWLPFLADIGGIQHWQLLDVDGTSVVTARQGGFVVGRRRTGPYGEDWISSGDPLTLASFHGQREEPGLGLLAAGPRHLTRSDGRWLQPEPMLYLGIDLAHLEDPLSLAPYRYARNTPTSYADRSGYIVETLWDVANVAIGAVSLGYNLAEGNYADAALDAGGLVLDIAATVAPGVPGGAGAAIKAARAADKVKDVTVAAMKHGDEAADVARVVASHGDEAADLAQTARKADPCSFTAGTEVVSVVGPLPIEEVQRSDRVVAFTGDTSSAMTVRLRPQLTAAGRALAFATALLGAAPPADAVVDVYDARTGGWVEALAAEVEPGDEARYRGHLLRVDADGWEDLGAVDAQVLAQADLAADEASWTSWPGPDSVVLVLDDAAPWHAWLDEVPVGERFAWQGLLYELVDADADTAQVRLTGDVLGRVLGPSVRTAPGRLDLVVARAEGRETLQVTGEHPVWVADAGGWVLAEALEPGDGLRTLTGEAAVVASVSPVHGPVVVHNFAVSGAPSYYARAADSDAAGVLVHNCPVGGGDDGARFVGQPDGQLVDTHSTPRGSYDQPGGGRTDVLQREDHGAGLSHTHDPKTNTNPKTGETFVNGVEKPGRPVSADDVARIASGEATPSRPKGR